MIRVCCTHLQKCHNKHRYFMQIIFPDEHRMTSRACQGVIKEDRECQSIGMSTTQWDVYVLGLIPPLDLDPLQVGSIGSGTLSTSF